MKIRIHGNSVRARLSRSEVAQLAEGRSVQQETKFSADSKLICTVTPVNDLPAATASFDGGTIAILLPQQQVASWANSEQVGLDGEVQIDAQTSLRLLIEKDFECLHARTEDAEDTFPHPLAQR